MPVTFSAFEGLTINDLKNGNITWNDLAQLDNNDCSYYINNKTSHKTSKYITQDKPY